MTLTVVFLVMFGQYEVICRLYANARCAMYDLKCIVGHNVVFLQLAELPLSFCNLTRLRYLDLLSNNLTDLPVFFQGFADLNFLNLDEVS